MPIAQPFDTANECRAASQTNTRICEITKLFYNYIRHQNRYGVSNTHIKEHAKNLVWSRFSLRPQRLSNIKEYFRNVPKYGRLVSLLLH